MKLTQIDRKFIARLVESEQHREVLCSRLQEEQLLVSPRDERESVLRALTNWVLLAIEVLTASFRKQTQSHSSFLCYDSSPISLPSRIPYIAYNRPGITVTGLSYRSRIITPMDVPALPLLLHTVICLLQSLLKPSVLSGQYTRILRTCLLLFSHLNRLEKPELFIFRLYQPASIFAAAFLKEHGIYVHLVPSTTPLAPFNRRLIGSSLKICNPYHLDEFAIYQTLGACKDSETWSVEDIVPLDAYYHDRPRPNLPQVLGLYTQGFWLRHRLGLLHPKWSAQLFEQEQELFRFLQAYVNEQPDLELVIFPHPMERRHYQKTGEYNFSAGTSGQIRVDFSGTSSNLSFDQVGLGLTTVSSVGFNRIFMGFRSLFFVPSEGFIDLSVPSPYRQLFCVKLPELREQVERWRTTSHSDFMQSIFGRTFWAGDKLS